MNRTSYYEALRSVDPRTQDVTGWLEYFVQGIAVEMARVEPGVAPSHAKRSSLTGGELAAIPATLLSIATATAGHLRLPGMTCDPKDDIVVARAKGGEADYMVSGDQDLLVLDEYERIQVVTPRRFVEILERKQ